MEVKYPVFGKEGKGGNNNWFWSLTDVRTVVQYK